MSQDPHLTHEDVIELPIEESFDLHPFRPEERLEMLDAYLGEALARDFEEVRIIHGRGRGVARAEVRAFLEDDPRVASLTEAQPGRGGWGATLARLDPLPEPAYEAGQPVFVGDIQGCAIELDEMLGRIEHAFGADFRLFVAGDAINRGDHNLQVLERIRNRIERGLGEMVLGNHELHMLRVALELQEPDENHTFHDVLDSQERDEWIAWLLRRPLATHGWVHGQRWVMVHASVHPDWTWAQAIRESRRVEHHLGSGDEALVRDLLALHPQEMPRRGSRRDVLGRITCARSVKGARCRWSSRAPWEEGGVAWHEAWLERGHTYGVVYGHWATQGLRVVPGLRGLDSGCIHHGRRGVGHLSAWVPQAETHEGHLAFDAPDDDIWQVRARYRRVRSPRIKSAASAPSLN
ncbi:MAG: Smr/MutS family protein [Actinomycetota bacterium]|nr:Smr/MutS family protein [Actinomycetota bacterium]